MWNLFIITVVASLAGVYVNSGDRTISMAARNEAREAAESMALYREAVIRYYTANAGLTKHSVSLEALKTANMVPAWSTLYTRSAESIWDNYRAADGTIYVYASSLPRTNIQAELVALSRNSYLAGVYKQSGKRLYSPVFGDTGISLAALASERLPDNTPVWIGYRR